MDNISQIISGVGISDARSVLYYLSRYLKQASHYEQYKKDIFEDDSRSYPNEHVISLTWAAVSQIEEVENRRIADFEAGEYIKWSDLVTCLESTLDPLPSLEEVKVASAFSGSLIMPSPKSVD